MPDNNIQFDTDQAQFKTNAGFNSSKSGLTNWLIKKGIAKDEASANKFMIGVFIVNIILIFLIVHFYV